MSRNPPVGFKRETWRPQPTSSWTPGQADTFRPSQAGPSSSSYRPPSPQRGEYDHRPPRYPDGPGEPSRPPPVRDFRTLADRFGRGGPEDRFNGRSYRPPDEERRQYDAWRPGEDRRSPPRRNGERFPGRNWRDRFDDDRPRIPPRDDRSDRDRFGPSPRGHQDSYRPPQSPPKARGRRESPDYGIGRRTSAEELQSRRSRSPRERSPASITRKRPLSPAPADTKRQRLSPPPRGRNSSPVPSATSSRFRPSPSRSRSPGRYSVERSPPRARSPESVRTRSPAPSTRGRSPSPPVRSHRSRRSPSPRIRKSSDRSHRSGPHRSPGQRSSPPPRPTEESPCPRGQGPPSRRPPSPPLNRGQPDLRHPPGDVRPPPAPPNLTHHRPDENQFTGGPPPPNFAQHVPPTMGPPPPFSGQHFPPPIHPPHPPFNAHVPPPGLPPYTNGFNGPPPMHQVPPPLAGPIKIDFGQATHHGGVSPIKTGWKTITNGMPTKTAVQRMFDDGPSPPRAPRSISPQHNGSPPSGPASERVPSPQRPQSPPSNIIAPYIDTAFQQWASQGAPLPLRDFLIHYFGRPPDGREVSQMERLLEQSKARATFTAPKQNHWSPNRPPPALHEAWNRHSASPTKEASANMVPLGESRYGKPVEVKEAPPADVPPSKAPVVVTPTEDVPKSRRKTAPGELYERLACVGEGTYGKVYKARKLGNGQFVALKRIRMEGEKDGFPVTAMREIKVLQSLKHPNVLRLIEMMVSKGSVYMVLEYMDHDLTGLLAHPEIEMSPANLKSLNYQMLSGLAYLHHRGILHRDMKGSNILLSGRGELKLADFGLARTYSKRKRDDYTNRVITLWYRSPELLLGETVYGPEVDMWSAGCIMLELFTSKPVFQGTDEISQLEVIYSILGTPSEVDWPGLGDLPWYELVKPKESLASRFEEMFAKWLTPAGLDLAKGLLAFDPSKRLSAESALQTAYFASEEPAMEMPTQLANCGEHHEMSAKIERHRRRQGSK